MLSSTDCTFTAAWMLACFKMLLRNRWSVHKKYIYDIVAFHVRLAMHLSICRSFHRISLMMEVPLSALSWHSDLNNGIVGGSLLFFLMKSKNRLCEGNDDGASDT